MLIALASVAAASAAKTEDGIKKAAKTEGRWINKRIPNIEH